MYWLNFCVCASSNMCWNSDIFSHHSPHTHTHTQQSNTCTHLNKDKNLFARGQPNWQAACTVRMKQWQRLQLSMLGNTNCSSLLCKAALSSQDCDSGNKQLKFDHISSNLGCLYWSREGWWEREQGGERHSCNTWVLHHSWHTHTHTQPSGGWESLISYLVLQGIIDPDLTISVSLSLTCLHSKHTFIFANTVASLLSIQDCAVLVMTVKHLWTYWA